MGIAPTGKRVTTTGVMIDRIVGGKIAEEWEEYDALGMMQQLGVIPSMAKNEDKS
jgi:predicted ester cyclase